MEKTLDLVQAIPSVIQKVANIYCLGPYFQLNIQYLKIDCIFEKSWGYS
jgi:hypothetical protein